MNWDAIGAVGEIVGALAVVFTLAYLATQIKLSRVASEIQGTYSSHESYARWRLALMENTDLAEAIAKANRNEQLSDAEEILVKTAAHELFIGAAVSTATNRRSSILYEHNSEVGYIVYTIRSNPGFESHWHPFKEMLRTVNSDYVDAVTAGLEKFSAEEKAPPNKSLETDT